MSKVAVIGAGQMGSGIAQVFAAKGWDVRLVDVEKDALVRALAVIKSSFERLIRKGTATETDRDAAVGRIVVGDDLGAVSDRDLVVEAASENEALKFRVFAELDRIAPTSAILATNTSSISITAIAGKTKRPAQVIGMHFMNPVPVMQLVEVIRGQATSAETTSRVMDIARQLGKTPVEVNDYPGFVANRVLMPMINEAVFCLMEGVASAESIDTVMKLGMNHPMGPLALADLIGLDTCLAIMNVLHEGLGDDKYRPCPLLKRMVAAGQLGKKSGQGFYTYNCPSPSNPGSRSWSSPATSRPSTSRRSPPSGTAPGRSRRT
ncbi:MAG: 3-hydroxybutyryl-CoA dehydrogenase [Gemmatimonadales bacterium]